MIEQDNEEYFSSDRDRDLEWEAGKRRREAARRARREQEQKRKERMLLFGATVIVALVVLIVLISSIGSCVAKGKTQGKDQEEITESLEEPSSVQTPEIVPEPSVEESQVVETSTKPPVIPLEKHSFTEASVVGSIPADVVSKYAILVDCDTNQIIAGRDMYVRMIPASMIKVLTVLTAYDYVQDMEDTTEITIDVTDYSFVNDCSNVGYGIGDRATIKDLFYGTILPSGADAAIALAKYCAGGSWEDFIPLMNQKIQDMGLKDTHVVNCVGIHDKEQYSTAYDMAVILRTAMDNPFLKEVLSAHTYTISPTKDHPEGILISNWYLRRIEDKDCHGTVVGGKTGYVDASRSCCASFAQDKNGKTYILVTASSTTSWRCINDHVAIFQKYLEE